MTPTHRRPVYDANANSGAFGALPDWDLSDLYPAPDAPELASDMSWLEKNCAAFARDYQGKLAELDASAMADCIARYEAIAGKAGPGVSVVGARYYQKPGGVVWRNQGASGDGKNAPPAQTPVACRP